MCNNVTRTAFRKRRTLHAPRIVLAVLLVTSILPASLSIAQGIIISPRPDPIGDSEPTRHVQRPFHSWTPFAIQSQKVDVSIQDSIGITTIEQVFINRSRSAAEGTYLFPIANNAAVHKFSMWMNGKEVNGELLDAKRARSIYETIVSKMQDPALLEYDGQGLIKASVFPIPASGECKIRLTYTEPIKPDAGLAYYCFPLRAPGNNYRTVGQFSMRVQIRTARPLANVFCPSHACSINRHGEYEAVVGFETNQLKPDRDFRLFYKTSDKPFGLALLTHSEPGEAGFFMARIAPRLGDDKDAAIPKNICFVLDTSGSMADDNKIAQAKKALKFCVTNLGKEDRFNVVTFSTDTRPFRDAWCKTDETTLDEARRFIDDLNAVGGTDINAAMQCALNMNPARPESVTKDDHADGTWRSNPYFIVFITDGEPTVGETEPRNILKNVAAWNNNRDNARNARVFVLGVGYQVNTKLLDRLADDNGGARDYVTPSENLELKISAFYSKLANPILAALKIAFEGVSVLDMYPKQLPDMFRGTELVVVGRYERPSGDTQQIVVTGKMRGDRKRFSYPCRFSWGLNNVGVGAGVGVGVGAHNVDFLPRVWAIRKIGYLLDELRLHDDSKELKDEVIRLSKRYGIMTPYTSFLVQQDEVQARRRGPGVRGGRGGRGSFIGGALRGAFSQNSRDMEESAKGQVATSGARAVRESQGNVLLQAAQPAAANMLLDDIADNNTNIQGERLMNFVGVRTFYLEGKRWVDSEYDGKTKPIPLLLYGREYYDFIADNRGVGRYFAQGDNVVLCWNGKVYETIRKSNPATETPTTRSADSPSHG